MEWDRREKKRSGGEAGGELSLVLWEGRGENLSICSPCFTLALAGPLHTVCSGITTWISVRVPRDQIPQCMLTIPTFGIFGQRGLIDGQTVAS